MNKNIVKKIAVIGLGYVGLPLAVEFGKKRSVMGFDINQDRINNLINGIDTTLEVSSIHIKEATNLVFTASVEELKDCNIFIIAVPTPIDEYKRPDLTLLEKSSQLVGSIIKKDDIVIYESTVYPGATEEVCVPIIEKISNLTFNKDFYCGYSPERINPGDKKHPITKIKKITSGSTQEIAKEVDDLYNEIIIAGTYMAQSIKIAEAAKVIENTQRDVNIALINELAIIFNKLGIDTKSVLDAAETKWNFLPFKPGLVGGHCIGVDPYYLAHKASEKNYNPEMILSGRRLNDSMGDYIVEQVIRLMTNKSINLINSNILIMGLAFKENCPDIRNTKVMDLVNGFKKFKINVDVYDTWADKDQTLNEYNIKLIDNPEEGKYDAIIFAVAHDEFKKLPINQIRSLGKKNHIIYDVKCILEFDDVDGRL